MLVEPLIYHNKIGLYQLYMQNLSTRCSLGLLNARIYLRLFICQIMYILKILKHMSDMA